MVDESADQTAGVAPLGLGRAVAIGIVAGVGLLVLLGAAWFWWETDGAWRAVPIRGVEDLGDNVGFSLFVGCYEGEIRGTADEHADRVVVSVEVRGEHSENDCMKGARVTLDEPLGVRDLIDGTTGGPAPLDCFADAPEESGSSC